MSSEPVTMWDRAMAYYVGRKLPWQTWGTRVKGDKFREESRELSKALRKYNRRGWPTEAEEVRHEIADVAITLAWIAHCFNTTIEECMDVKTSLDHGRGAGKHYLAGT